jgi:hypothetical protein
MEPKYSHPINGQSVLQADLNSMSENAALAGDRVFAELLRVAPFVAAGSLKKAILPFQVPKGALDAVGQPLITPIGTVSINNAASGSVDVFPFRAIIGTRGLASNGPAANWRDIRTAVFVGTTVVGLETPARHRQVLAANASGNPRWDLVYAVFALGATASSEARKIKSPTTKEISSTSVVTKTTDTVSISVVQGTPSATPALPALPTDSGSNYYIPLAYVRVPTGWSATSNGVSTNIWEIAPIVSLSSALGGRTVRPATTMHAVTSLNDIIRGWNAVGVGNRPKVYLPPSMCGSESLILALDLTSVTPSHQQNQAVDSGVWSYRLCKFTAVARSEDIGFAWNFDGEVGSIPSGEGLSVSAGNAMAAGMGHTFPAPSPTEGIVAEFVGNDLVGMTDGTTVTLYCDIESGALKVRWTGTPACKLIIWLEFTAPFGNFL